MNTVKVAPSEFKTISLEAAIQKAPAIAATEPGNSIWTPTKRYNFTSTLDIIEAMQNQGWELTNAKQSKSKDSMRVGHGPHMVEFQNPTLFVRDQEGLVEARPTVLFINSSDGTRPLQTEIGIFRLVCSNGLIIKSHDFGGFKERHSKLNVEAVKQLLGQKVLEMESAITKINQWNSVEMKAIDRKKFATDALILRIGEDRQPEEHELQSILEPRRNIDSSNTLWHVFNRVQENLVKGGFELGNRSARAITNPITDLTLNQGLWSLAESYSA
jgi:hypothetical protein